MTGPGPGPGEGSGTHCGPAPCACLQQIQSNFIVVIHPGSATLRLGRATDTLPVGIPHVIARRQRQPGQAACRDSWLLRDGLNVSQAPQCPPTALELVFVCRISWPFRLCDAALTLMHVFSTEHF